MTGQSVRIAAICAIAFGSASLLGCFIVAPIIYDEIVAIQTELDAEMFEFKIASDSLWYEIVNLAKSGTPRFSRQATPDVFSNPTVPTGGSSKCECKSAGANKCPAGAPGPPGSPGEDGHSGPDGIPGIDGKEGGAAETGNVTLPCFNCPPGPQGPNGPPGPIGPSGPPGQAGTPGPSGKSGNPGVKGPAGDKGKLGVEGKLGAKGLPGQNGQGGKGRPGSKGPPGPPGIMGVIGAPGPNSPACNATGPAGPLGATGPKGQDGKLGDQGGPGNPGSSGNDAQYCPCPGKNGLLPPPQNPVPSGSATVPASSVATVGGNLTKIVPNSPGQNSPVVNNPSAVPFVPQGGNGQPGGIPLAPGRIRQ